MCDSSFAFLDTVHVSVLCNSFLSSIPLLSSMTLYVWAYALLLTHHTMLSPTTQRFSMTEWLTRLSNRTPHFRVKQPQPQRHTKWSDRFRFPLWPYERATNKETQRYSFCILLEWQDNAFYQQRLKYWQPLFTPVNVIITFSIIGVLFIGIGIPILISSNDVGIHRPIQYRLWSIVFTTEERSRRSRSVSSRRMMKERSVQWAVSSLTQFY